MKKLKLIALSLIVLGAADAAILTHDASSMTKIEAGHLLFVSHMPIFDPSYGYLLPTDIKFDAAFESGFLSGEDEEPNVPGDRAIHSEHIRIGPWGERGDFVPDILIDSLVPVSADSSNSVQNVAGSVASPFSGMTAAGLPHGEGSNVPLLSGRSPR